MALTQVPVSMVDFSVNPTLSGGTANGVAYLNGSKVVTTGSALAFDGSKLDVAGNVNITGGGTSFGNGLNLIQSSVSNNRWGFVPSGGALYLGKTTDAWSSNSVVAVFDSSGNLGVGTSSPGVKLDTVGVMRSTFNSLSNGGPTSHGLVLRQSTTDTKALVAGYSTSGNQTGAYIQAVNFGTAYEDLVIQPQGGNLGLGVTPSTSNAGKTFELNYLGNQMRCGGVNDMNVESNTYYNSGFKYASNGTATRYAQSNGAHQWHIAASGTAGNAITFTQAMTLDASGNLGLGVTPSAWGSAFKSLDIGAYASFWNTSGGTIGVAYNAYHNGTNFIYRASGIAPASYQQSLGTHSWYTAPSGTAGNAITFTQAMTLDASGNLGVGETSPALRLHVKSASAAIGYFETSDTGIGPYVIWRNGTTSIGDVGSGKGINGSGNATDFMIASRSTYPLLLGTGSTERARITSGGEVYIAGTTDQGAYNLQVNGTGVWGAGAYVNGSDARLKEEVQDLAPALDVIASLRPVTFRYKEDYSKDQNVQPGFIAQELQTAMAGQAYVDGVIQSGPQHLNVAYQSLIPLLTKAIQELKAEFDAYKATHP